MLERRNINAATKQYVDEGCYSWGVCDVLKDISPRDCTYVTMFREPKRRLVSAFIYCIYKQPRDQCCGWNRLLEDQHYDKQSEATKFRMRANASIVDFARFWGNFGFRQFLINDEALDYPNFFQTAAMHWPAWHSLSKCYQQPPTVTVSPCSECEHKDVTKICFTLSWNVYRLVLCERWPGYHGYRRRAGEAPGCYWIS